MSELSPPPVPDSPSPPPAQRPGRAWLWVLLGGGTIASLVLVAAMASVAFNHWWRPYRLAQRLTALSDACRYEEGLAIAARELPEVRSSAALSFAMENLHYGANHLEETKFYGRETLAVEPGNELAARLVISICRDFDDNEAGYLVGKDWVARNAHGAEIYKDLAMVADDAGHDDESLGFAAKAFGLKPDDARIASVYFYYAFLEHGAEATLTAVRDWAARNYADEFFWAQIGKGLSEIGAYREAIPRLRRALEMGSEDDGVAEEMLDCYRGLGDRSAAERFLDVHFRSHAPSATLWRMLGSIRYDAGAFDAALAGFREAQRLDPENVATMANLVFALYELHRSADAIMEGEAWLAQGREPSALLYRALGNACFALSRWVEAEARYRAALELDPGSYTAARELVSTLVEQGRARAAVEFGTAWREAHPDDGDETFDVTLARATAAADDSSPDASSDDADRATSCQPSPMPEMATMEQPI